MPRRQTPPVLMIGLDAADAELVDGWCREGFLPTLDSLRREGIWATLETTAAVMHVSAWPTVYTGTGPAHHGLYHAYQVRAGDQDVHRTRTDECALPPFWKYLDDAGKNCIVMDAFMNHPMEDFKGLQILEWGTWTWFSKRHASPDGLWRKLLKNFGPYPAPEHSKILEMPRSAPFRQKLIDGASQKSRIVRWLLREFSWDCCFVTFGEPHAAGHYLWHHTDPLFPAHSTATAQGFENAVRDVYAAVDKAIGQILHELDDDVTVLVTSPDGMGPNYAAPHHLPAALRRLGLYTVSGENTATENAATPRRGTRRNLTKLVRDLIPVSVRRSISRCMPRHMQHQLSMRWANANIDWENTSAFLIPNANEGYIRVNLQGREPHGTVADGHAYREMCDLLRESALELTNPQTNVPAARQVVCTHEVYCGERLSSLPDVVVNWNPDAKTLSQLHSESCGLIDGKAAYQVTPYYTGNHRPTAFLIACGPGIGSGKTIENGHIADIAATLLALMDVEPPGHFAGRVWEEML